jgi:hypothetical protein
VESSAVRAGRTISPEHFGVSIGYCRGEIDAATRASVAARRRGHVAEELVPTGLAALRALIEQYIDAGFSKFVLRPLDLVPAARPQELNDLAAAVLDLQS